MDNKAYLDQIAVKGKNATNKEPLLSPLMIKLLVAGVIMLITVIIVGAIFNSANDKITQSYERLYLRISQMCGNQGPYNKYSKFINSSNLAALANQLETSLTNTNKDLSGQWSSLKVDTTSTANRIMQIKTIEQQILQKTKNKALPAILSNSISDLDILYEKFRDFNDTLYD